MAEEMTCVKMLLKCYISHDGCSSDVIDENWRYSFSVGIVYGLLFLHAFTTLNDDSALGLRIEQWVCPFVTSFIQDVCS